MKIVARTLIVFLIFSSCKLIAQKKIAHGFPKSITNENPADTMNFNFDTISSETFTNYKTKYDSKIDTDYSRILVNDTSFRIETSDSIFTFRADTTNYDRFGSYDGFLKPLGLYIVTDIDGNNEIGSLILIDKKTNSAYEVESAYDDPCYLPFISPGNNYIASFSNDSYNDNHSFITIIKIKKKKGKFSYSSVKYFTTEEWSIKELVWINENSFALHVVTTTQDASSGEVSEIENYLRVGISN